MATAAATTFFRLQRETLSSDGLRIATAAVLSCDLCDQTIDGMGGPGAGALCCLCGADLAAGRLRGAVRRDPVLTDPVRVQRRRERGWRMPDGGIYVGRGTRWANPWPVYQDQGGLWFTTGPGLDRRIFGDGRAGTHAIAVDLFRLAATGGRGSEALKFKPSDIRTLRGHSLVCWCALDLPCHATVLMELANA